MSKRDNQELNQRMYDNDESAALIGGVLRRPDWVLWPERPCTCTTTTLDFSCPTHGTGNMDEYKARVEGAYKEPTIAQDDDTGQTVVEPSAANAAEAAMDLRVRMEYELYALVRNWTLQALSDVVTEGVTFTLGGLECKITMMEVDEGSDRIRLQIRFEDDVVRSFTLSYDDFRSNE